MSRNNKRWSPANVMLISAIALLLALFLFIALNKIFDSDEMETLSAASFIFDGQVPYRDFWQMHTPLSYYFFAPLFLFFRTIKIFYAARFIVYLLLILNGYLLSVIARYLFSRRIAVFSFLAYLASLAVIFKMTEIRPDILVVIFSNLSLIFLIWKKLPAARSFFLAGIFGALAFLSKQSGIVFVLSLLVFFVIRALSGRSRFWSNDIFSKERFNAGSYSFFLGGFLLPCVIFVFSLLSQGAFEPFLRHAIDNDFLRAALFLQGETTYWTPGNFLILTLLTNFMLFLSAIILFFYLVLKKSYVIKFANSYLLIFTLFCASFISLFLTLQVWEQDFLPLAQYLALLGAPMLCFFYEYIYDLCCKRKRKFLGAVLDFYILALLCLPPLFRPQRIMAEGFFDLGRQLEPFDKIISLTNKDDRCLSIEQHCPFRPGPYFYRVTSPELESPAAVKYKERSLVNELLHNNIVTVTPLVNSYAICMQDLARVIKNNYLPYSKDFYIPGKIFQAAGRKTKEFNVLVDGYYRTSKNTKKMRVDGKTIKTDIIYLKKGRHSVYLSDPREGYGIIYDLQANKTQA